MGYGEQAEPLFRRAEGWGPQFKVWAVTLSRSVTSGKLFNLESLSFCFCKMGVRSSQLPQYGPREPRGGFRPPGGSRVWGWGLGMRAVLRGLCSVFLTDSRG